VCKPKSQAHQILGACHNCWCLTLGVVHRYNNIELEISPYTSQIPTRSLCSNPPTIYKTTTPDNFMKTISIKRGEAFIRGEIQKSPLWDYSSDTLKAWSLLLYSSQFLITPTQNITTLKIEHHLTLFLIQSSTNTIQSKVLSSLNLSPLSGLVKIYATWNFVLE